MLLVSLYRCWVMIASTSLKFKAREKKGGNRRRTLEAVKTNRKVFIVFFKN